MDIQDHHKLLQVPSWIPSALNFMVGGVNALFGLASELCKTEWHAHVPSLKKNYRSKKISLIKTIELLKNYLPIIKTVPTAIPPP